MAEAKQPPQPPRKRHPTPLVPNAHLRQSLDAGEAVRAQEEAERVHGRLLTELATERQAREAEQQARAELERELQARKLLAVQPAPARVESMPPRDGALDLRARLTAPQVVAILTGLGGLVAAIVANVRAETPPPRVIDNSAPIRELQAQVSAQAATIEALREHQQASEDWTANAFEAACVDVRRPSGARALPATEVNPIGTAKRKCPVVRLEDTQPVLGDR